MLFYSQVTAVCTPCVHYTGIVMRTLYPATEAVHKVSIGNIGITHGLVLCETDK